LLVLRTGQRFISGLQILVSAIKLDIAVLKIKHTDAGETETSGHQPPDGQDTAE
jgi:hypothetical protein